MSWIQNYDPFGNIGLSAVVAAVPLLIFLYMLGVRRAKGHLAAMVSLVCAVVLAIVGWKMPVGLAISATLNGAAFGLFPIVWIIIPSIWVYHMTVESGQFEVIKNSLASITDDRRLQALFIAFAFSSFLEGTAGYGTPVAITSAMLVGLGFNPVYAAGICLIANTAPVAFGGIGIPIVVSAQVTGIDPMEISKVVGRQLPLLGLIVPMWIVVIMCGWKRAMEVLPAVLVTGILFSSTIFLVSNYVNPYLPDIIAAIVTIVGLLIFLKVWRPKTIWLFPGETPSAGRVKLEYSAGEVCRAWAPYLILAVLVFLWADDKYTNFKAMLIQIDKTLPFLVYSWPGLDGLVIKTTPVVLVDTPYAAKYMFNLFSAAGTAIFVSGLLALAVIPNYSAGRAASCFVRTTKILIFPITTISMILGLAYIMNYSGMSSTLGLGFTGTGALFPFFSPVLGWLGVFLTGSDTSSDALFCSMQKTAAQQLNIDPTLTVAANSTGGVCGKMISPQSISVATAATGQVGEEGTIFRFTILHSLAMLAIISVLTYLQAYSLHWMLP